MATEGMAGDLVSSLNQLSETIGKLLDYGKTAAKESVDEFVNGRIGKMFGMVSAYKECLQRLGVRTKYELEDLIESNSGKRDVREAGEQLLDIEQDWDNFLTEVDKSLKETICDTVKLGETGPIDIPLVDARTDQETSLQDYLGDRNLVLDDILSRNGSVIVVSFGERAGAVRWLEEMKLSLPMLLNADKKVYHRFGLKRSAYKVWRVMSLVYYAEQVVAGRTLPRPYENVKDDPHQMGGDFILDKAGVVRFMYPSATAVDRPSISLLLQELQKIEETEWNDVQ